MVVAALAIACETTDEFAPKQRTQIETYLTRNKLEYAITSGVPFVDLNPEEV